MERSCRLRVEAPRLLRKVGAEGVLENRDPAEEGTGRVVGDGGRGTWDQGVGSGVGVSVCWYPEGVLGWGPPVSRRDKGREAGLRL